MGGTATRWRGTAFDCPLDNSEITLRHSQFADNQGITVTCNNGDLVGRSIGVVNDCYTSQLNVTVRESFNNKTVQCAFTSLVGTTIIGESFLRVVSGMAKIMTLSQSTFIMILIQQQILIHFLITST